MGGGHRDARGLARVADQRWQPARYKAPHKRCPDLRPKNLVVNFEATREKAHMVVSEEPKKTERETGPSRLAQIADLLTIKRVFEMASMWPKVTNDELRDRARVFVLSAEPDEFLRMHQAASDILGKVFWSDKNVRPVIDAFSGRQVGFAVKKFYKATLTVEAGKFKVDPGIETGVPVVWCASRDDYAEIVLGHYDPVRMFLTRRMGATRMGTLLKWWLPYMDVLVNDEVMDRYSSLGPTIEKKMGKQLAAMGY
jgi:hypothetical protein